MIVYTKHRTTDWLTLNATHLSNKDLLEELMDKGIKAKRKGWFESQNSFLKRISREFHRKEILIQKNGISI